MKTHVIIAYRQYLRWSCTHPFDSLKEATRHKERYLDSNEILDKVTGEVLAPNTNQHIVDITFIEVELPE